MVNFEVRETVMINTDELYKELQEGKLTMYNKEMLFNSLNQYNGTLEEYFSEITEKYKYIEAQLWNDEFKVYSKRDF